MISFTKGRIICVDYSRYDCELFVFILTLAGYEVESAQSLQDALQLLEKDLFDLGLFSISRESSREFELLAEIRAIAPSMPVIICSDDDLDATRQQALQVGAQVFLTKPINFDSLVATIAQLIP